MQLVAVVATKDINRHVWRLSSFAVDIVDTISYHPTETLDAVNRINAMQCQSAAGDGSDGVWPSLQLDDTDNNAMGTYDRTVLPVRLPQICT